jgi:hypothetical protein
MGPVYLEGRMVLSLSFVADGGNPSVASAALEGSQAALQEAPLEVYRLWDDASQSWYANPLELRRYESIDVVLVADASGEAKQPVWQGSVDTHARIIETPDLGAEGMSIDEQAPDLRWRRVESGD